LIIDIVRRSGFQYQGVLRIMRTLLVMTQCYNVNSFL